MGYFSVRLSPSPAQRCPSAEALESLQITRYRSTDNPPSFHHRDLIFIIVIIVITAVIAEQLAITCIIFFALLRPSSPPATPSPERSSFPVSYHHFHHQRHPLQNIVDNPFMVIIVEG